MHRAVVAALARLKGVRVVQAVVVGDVALEELVAAEYGLSQRDDLAWGAGQVHLHWGRVLLASWASPGRVV